MHICYTILYISRTRSSKYHRRTNSSKYSINSNSDQIIQIPQTMTWHSYRMSTCIKRGSWHFSCFADAHVRVWPLTTMLIRTFLNVSNLRRMWVCCKRYLFDIIHTSLGNSGIHKNGSKGSSLFNTPRPTSLMYICYTILYISRTWSSKYHERTNSPKYHQLSHLTNSIPRTHELNQHLTNSVVAILRTHELI